MFSFQRWMDLFGDQVSYMREMRTGKVGLLYNSEIESIPDMDDALFECYKERIKPRVAAERFVALTS